MAFDILATEEKLEEALERPAQPRVHEQAQDRPANKNAKPALTLTDNYTDKNKNRLQKCPMCDFSGTHLQKHILAKHGDTVTSKSKAARVVAVSEKKLEAENRPTVRELIPMWVQGLQRCCNSIEPTS